MGYMAYISTEHEGAAQVRGAYISLPYIMTQRVINNICLDGATLLYQKLKVLLI